MNCHMKRLFLYVCVLLVPGCNVASPVAQALYSSVGAANKHIGDNGKAFADSLKKVLGGDSKALPELTNAHKALLATFDAELAQLDPKGTAPYHVPTEAKRVAGGQELYVAFKTYLEAERQLCAKEYADTVRVLGDPQQTSRARDTLDKAKLRSQENLKIMQTALQAFYDQHGFKPPKAFEGWFKE